MMKRYFFLLICLLATVLTISAQRPMRPGLDPIPRVLPEPFNPEKFEAELEQYIVTEVCLSPREAAQFFPLYREMRCKQRALFGAMRRGRYVNLKDNDECQKMIRENDKRDVEMKKLQQDYHNKFMKVLPASRVFRIIQAEENFHRKMFKRAAKRDNFRRHP